jgi:hypothetical protein
LKGDGQTKIDRHDAGGSKAPFRIEGQGSNGTGGLDVRRAASGGVKAIEQRRQGNRAAASRQSSGGVKAIEQ